MAGIKGNRRIIYTKKTIQESLITLLKTKDIHQITVTDICKLADINRGTFYAHYKDAFDLLQSMEDEFFSQIVMYISETPTDKYSDLLLLNVLDLIVLHKDLCKILLCRHRDNRLLDKLIFIANKANLEHIYNYTGKLDNTYTDYYIKYVVGGCVAIIQSWLENDMPQSPQEIVKIINTVSTLSNNYFSSTK